MKLLACEKLPFCQDTGYAVLFIEIGQEIRIEGGFLTEALNEGVAYAELGAEAVFRLKLKDFPAIVVNNMTGGDLYEKAEKKYKQN